MLDKNPETKITSENALHLNWFTSITLFNARQKKSAESEMVMSMKEAAYTTLERPVFTMQKKNANVVTKHKSGKNKPNDDEFGQLIIPTIKDFSFYKCSKFKLRLL